MDDNNKTKRPSSLDEKVESLRKIFIEDKSTSKIRFTCAGRDLLEKRFAKVGIDIKQITTKKLRWPHTKFYLMPKCALFQQKREVKTHYWMKS